MPSEGHDLAASVGYSRPICVRFATFWLVRFAAGLVGIVDRAVVGIVDLAVVGIAVGRLLLVARLGAGSVQVKGAALKPFRFAPITPQPYQRRAAQERFATH